MQAKGNKTLTATQGRGRATAWGQPPVQATDPPELGQQEMEMKFCEVEVRHQQHQHVIISWTSQTRNENMAGKPEHPARLHASPFLE